MAGQTVPQGVDLPLMGQVDDVAVDLGEQGQFGRDPLQRRRVDVDQFQAGLGLGIAPGDGQTNAAGRAGDERALAAQRDELFDGGLHGVGSGRPRRYGFASVAVGGVGASIARPRGGAQGWG